LDEGFGHAVSAKVQHRLRAVPDELFAAINGNAIYKLGDPCFEAFIKHVRAEYQYFAFDTSINYFRYSSRHVRMFQATAHKFMYTTVVVDYSSVPYDDATLQELPGCFLVHGKYMMLSKEKTALARLGLGTSGT